MVARATLAALLFWILACSEEAVRLTSELPLSQGLRQLEVTRVGRGGERVGARFDPALLSASAMHERGREAGEGEVHGRWVLGEPPWDAVGFTRQVSGAEARDGLWAHPRDGTSLSIEAEVAIDGAALEGFFGLTDFSIEHARSRGVEAPVHFELALEGFLLVQTEVARTPGWSRFRASVPPGPSGPRRLRVRIASEDDTWAHFVFDVWAVD